METSTTTTTDTTPVEPEPASGGGTATAAASSSTLPLLSSSPATNPMQTETVRDVLFAVCDPDDLARFRLVSSGWHRASLNSWRSTATLIIHGPVPPTSSATTTTGAEEGAAGPPPAPLPPIRRPNHNRGNIIETTVNLYLYQCQLMFGQGYQSIADIERQSWPCCSVVANNADPPPPGGILQLDQFLELIRRESSSSSAEEDSDAEPQLRLASKPFSGFHLKHWPLETSTRERGFLDDEEVPSTSSSLPNHIQFWDLCGPWIKRLTLEACRYTDYDGGNLRAILFRFTPNLVELQIDGLVEPDFGGDSTLPPISPAEHEAQTNLKILEMRSCSRSRSRWPIGWRNMLNGFPKLETIRLAGASCNSLNPLLAAIARLRMDGKQLSLKHLETLYLGGRDAINQVTLDLFRVELRWLETLKIQFGAEREESVIKQLVQLFSSTLRTLSCTRTIPLDGNNFARWTPFQGFLGEASFEQLKDLRLNGPIVPNFGFLRNTPNLEVLHLDYFTQEERGWLEKVGYKVCPVQDTFLPEAGGDVRLEKLTEFRTERLIDNHEAFLNITEWMPNVTRLSAPLTQDTFQVVCGAWNSTLKELHITKEGSIGDEITGLGVVRRPDAEPFNGRTPNVTDLKELTKFTQDKGSGGFTDLAMLYGFRFLPKLKTLQIFATRELSADVFEILKKQNVEFSWSKCRAIELLSS